MINQGGILRIRTPEQVTQDKEAQDKAKNPSPMSTVVDSLSGYLDTLWSQAKEANREPRKQMLKNLRMTKREYEADKLTAIRQLMGSEAYWGGVGSKCRDAEAWLLDLFSLGGVKSWDIEHTPVPDLPYETKEQIAEEVADEIMKLQGQLAQIQAMTGQQISPAEIRKYLMQYANQRKIEEYRELEREAQERCDLMEKKIDDQLQEGGFSRAFADFLWYITRLKTAYLKAPVIRNKLVAKWENGEYTYVTDNVPEVECPSPFDMFPMRDTASPDNGDMFQVHKLSKEDLFSLIGVENYSETEIRAIISEYDNGNTSNWLTIDDKDEVEKAEKEAKNLTFLPTSLSQALEFNGSIPGKFLIDWAAKAEMDLSTEVDPERQYKVECWKIGKHVIKALINPDPLGRSKYYATSWARVPGSIWGQGIPELVEDLQDICNSIIRALQNNVGLASGPIIEQDFDRIPDDTPLHPLMRLYSSSAEINTSPALRLYDIPMHAGELMQAFQFFSSLMDDLTIPAYAHGNPDVGGAGSTASGFSMLLSGASRGMKLVAYNIDEDVFRPMISAFYRYNMMYDPDDSIKGDARVVVKAAINMSQKEQTARRTIEMLGTTANQFDMQIIGAEGRAKLLRAALRAVELDADDILPEKRKEELQQLIQSMLPQGQPGSQLDPNQQNGQAMLGGTPPKPQNLDVAGNEMGGAEFQQPIQARAMGGPIEKNNPYLVGEQGPEFKIDTPSPTMGPANQASPPKMSDMRVSIDDGNALSRAYDGNGGGLYTSRDNVYANQPKVSVVGKNGPEIIKPSSNGFIIPNPITPSPYNSAEGYRVTETKPVSEYATGNYSATTRTANPFGTGYVTSPEKPSAISVQMVQPVAQQPVTQQPTEPFGFGRNSRRFY